MNLMCVEFGNSQTTIDILAVPVSKIVVADVTFAKCIGEEQAKRNRAQEISDYKAG